MKRNPQAFWRCPRCGGVTTIVTEWISGDVTLRCGHHVPGHLMRAATPEPPPWVSTRALGAPAHEQPPPSAPVAAGEAAPEAADEDDPFEWPWRRQGTLHPLFREALTMAKAGDYARTLVSTHALSAGAGTHGLVVQAVNSIGAGLAHSIFVEHTRDRTTRVAHVVIEVAANLVRDAIRAQLRARDRAKPPVTRWGVDAAIIHTLRDYAVRHGSSNVRNTRLCDVHWQWNGLAHHASALVLDDPPRCLHCDVSNPRTGPSGVGHFALAGIRPGVRPDGSLDGLLSVRCHECVTAFPEAYAPSEHVLHDWFWDRPYTVFADLRGETYRPWVGDFVRAFQGGRAMMGQTCAQCRGSVGRQYLLALQRAGYRVPARALDAYQDP